MFCIHSANHYFYAFQLIIGSSCARQESSSFSVRALRSVSVGSRAWSLKMHLASAIYSIRRPSLGEASPARRRPVDRHSLDTTIAHLPANSERSGKEETCNLRYRDGKCQRTTPELQSPIVPKERSHFSSVSQYRPQSDTRSSCHDNDEVKVTTG